MKTFLYYFITAFIIVNVTFSQDIRSSLKDKVFNESDFISINDSCSVFNPERHDDFTHENGYLLNSDSARFVLKMTPQVYPWTYTKVCLAWSRSNSGSSIIVYDIIVYDASGSGGSPGSPVTTFSGRTITDIPIFPQVVWDDAAVSLPTLNSGSYYIGVRWKNSVFPNAFIAGDESAGTTLWPGYLSGSIGAPVWTPVQNQFSSYKCLCIRTEGSQMQGFPPFSCGNVAYVPISGTNGPSGDDVIQTYALPFTFNYVGTAYSTVSICTNGFVIFGSSSSTEFNNDLCTTNSGLLNMLAPFWDDLLPTAGQIQYTTLGSAPNRIFVIQWTNVPYFSGSGNVTFQVRLLENNGCNLIDYIYGPCTPNPSASGNIGINKSPGGSGNIISVVPGPICASTTTSNTTCTEVPYDLTAGRFYRFGSCMIGINNQTGTIPNQYTLSQNYPNPFNPTTKITYGLPKSGNVELKIYDILGREVKTLVNEFKQSGTYDISFDASNFASGLYFYTLKSGDFTETKKMLLVK